MIFWWLVPLVLLLSWPIASSASPVIIDTDLGFEDARALALFEAGRRAGADYELVAIVTSDGANGPREGAEQAARILAFLGRGDVPIGVGPELREDPPAWREQAASMRKADLPKPGKRSYPVADDLLTEVLAKTEAPVVYICCGPLTNLARQLERNEGLASEIEVVYYWGTLPDSEDSEWNTRRDLEAARKVFASDLTIYAIDVVGALQLRFDRDLSRAVASIETPPAALISRLHDSPGMRDFINQGRSRVRDEVLVLSLLEPRLIELESQPGSTTLYTLGEWSSFLTRKFFVDLLRGPADE